jgi:BirA family biotin operon repressor/biotin-[acetyl-CoA-carboxylase] ligase
MDLVFLHLPIVDSTNTYAKKHFAEFAPGKMTCVYAEQQTAGRGRYDRKWHSPSGSNIYATLAFRLSKEVLYVECIGLLLTLSLAEVLIQEGLHPKIKWPNDIQLHGKKISGTLTETVFHPHGVDLFVGIGINVNTPPEEFVHLDQPVSSLKIEARRSWDRDALLKRLIHQFLNSLETFKKEGFSPFHKAFERLLAYQGKTVRCFDGNKEWVGICRSITPEGHLILELAHGKLHTLSAGDLS